MYFLLEVVGFENVQISTLSSGGENSVCAGVLKVLMTSKVIQKWPVVIPIMSPMLDIRERSK